MARLLEYAESGDNVTVWRIDRLGWSIIDILNVVELLRGRGLQMGSLSDRAGPAMSTGRLMLHMPTTLTK